MTPLARNLIKSTWRQSAPQIPDQPPSIKPPADSSRWPEWRASLAEWRTKARAALSYDGATYTDPSYAWAAKCFSCAMVMSWDGSFFRGDSGDFKVADFLKDAQARFGGHDAVVLWHAYPRIGFDDRNQFDYYRELPQGLHGVSLAVAAMAQQGVRTFIDYNPWDTGTGRELGEDDTKLAEILKATQADGIFLDTLSQASDMFRTHISLGKVGVALETEDACPIDRLGVHHLSWGQWFDTDEAPAVLRNRWFEQRHMMHMINRWDRDHSDELHLAWMNGAGMLVWENVFGSYNPWSDQNRAILQQMLPIQRAFSSHFSEGAWTPLVPQTTAGIYASLWAKDGVRIWTVVNRTAKDVDGPWFDSQTASGEQLFDLSSGAALSAPKGTIPAKGIAAVAAFQPGKLNPEATEFMNLQKARMVSPVHSVGPAITIAASTIKIGPNSHPPATMQVVAAGKFNVVSHFRRRECGERGYMPAPNSGAPQLHQIVEETRELELGGFAVAKAEVTNAEFRQFLMDAEYQPVISENFLAHWINGNIPRGAEHQPVVYVDLNDARAYAKWRHMRLPTDAEWQIAMEAASFPRLKPEVWNLTGEDYTDGHTRFQILKGGSSFQCKGSDWYADGGIHAPDFAAKFIRIWPGLDRCSTIGFRIACSTS
jgi:formylglycine-generating enzyme